MSAFFEKFIKKSFDFFVLFLAISWIAFSLLPSSSKENTKLDLVTFGQTPTLYNGRIVPLDTIFRNTLLSISGKQSVRIEGKKLSALEWGLQVINQEEGIDTLPLFRFLNPDKLIHDFLHVPHKSRYISYSQLVNHSEKITQQATEALKLESQLRSPFQKEIVHLNNSMILYEKLSVSFFPRLDKSHDKFLNDYMSSLPSSIDLFIKFRNDVSLSEIELEQLHSFNHRFKALQNFNQQSLFFSLPDKDYKDEHKWIANSEGILHTLDQKTELHPLLPYFGLALDSFATSDTQTFNTAAQSIRKFHKSQSAYIYFKCQVEQFFNAFQPFYKSCVLYIFAFLFVMISMIVWPVTCFNSSKGLMWLATSIHTFGLILRVFLTERPPVTNLYSSAIFVGWVAILLGMYLTHKFKNKMGIVVSSVIGFLTLIIAHHLSLTGDTMEMMQAVLDTNFWLATHVVTISMGYSATFLGGFLGIFYIFYNIIKPSHTNQLAELGKMIYGILCFALLFSFLGTVLGGIWADQSWGRFWGWDPKENGALLIVLWNAIILHTRLAGYIKHLGISLMAIFGNIITAISWFGVNMLGIGLHSYGFMEKSFIWLMLFILSQLIILAIGLVSAQKSIR